MKRFCGFAGLVLLLSLLPGRAQEPPAVIAERQEAEERQKRLNARLENLEEAVQSLQKSLRTCQEELRSVRDEAARANNNQSSQESLKSLERAIKEVDRKRMEDNEKVLAEMNRMLSRIEKSLVGKPSATGRQAPAATTSSAAGAEKGYEYAIQDGDTLGGIVKKLKEQGMKVTQKQVMDANPNVNWNKLRIGQKIFIPAPAQP